MVMRSCHARTVSVLFAVAAAVTACGPGAAPQGGPTTVPRTSPGDTPRPEAGFAQFADISVPAGAKMDIDRSLVLGGQESWIGRLSMTTPGTTAENYDFFVREMPRFGWQEFTTVRSDVSVLTYIRGERVATVQISARTLGGTKVDVTVSPRGRAAPSAVGGGAVSPAPLR